MEFNQAYFETQYRNYSRQNPARKLDYYCRLVSRAAAGVASPRILDIGCAFALFLSRLGSPWERFGFDASDFAIRAARERDPSLRLEVSLHPPFDGPFDAVTAFDVLEHIPDLEDIFSRLRERLREGGHLVFVVPVYDGPTGPLIRALDRDPTHIHRRSRDFWLSIAARHLELVDWVGIYRYLLPGGYYLHLPTRLFRAFTPAIACVARRRSSS